MTEQQKQQQQIETIEDSIKARARSRQDRCVTGIKVTYKL